MITGIVEKVSGPLIVASGMRNANMFDVVRVGEMKLIGEIIEMRGDKASIQVYEETAGVGPGDKVYSTDMPLSVELGPGLIENIYDGVQRPLETMYSKYGTNITKGIDEPALDREKIWHFDATATVGEMLSGGDTVGTVKETEVVTQKIMLPPDVSGELLEINSGDYNVTETIGKVKKPDGSIYELKLAQKWPVRIPRPYKRKLSLDEPMVTGQRIIDALFPIAKGGTACVPGPFGSGKTVVQHQLAKWADVDIVVYIGCGERGNEMTDVLREFPELKDPRSGHSLMKRTVLIANTSDMPVAAREASIYTGITIAEYFRDMGYGVAVIADSTSRWAEALREMSGRLEEMPGEEGYPAYLTSRLAQFYERSGKVVCKGKEDNIGSITAIGAVSPTGGDLSEPVTQATLRIVKVFWGLDYSLAYRRHFPAINWLNSYSLYKPQLSEWFDKNVSDKWTDTCNTVMRILSEESELDEIVKLIGMDALSPSDRVTLEVARSIREDFLQQNAFDLDDSYTELAKQMGLLELVLYFGEKARAAIEKGADVEKLSNLPVRETIGRAKAVSADKYKDEFANIKNEIDSQIENLISEEAAL